MFTAIWTSKKFRDGNPTLYQAFLAALKEATDYVEHNPRQAAEYWIEDSKSKLPLDTAAKIVGGKQVHHFEAREVITRLVDIWLEGMKPRPRKARPAPRKNRSQRTAEKVTR